MTEEPKRSDRLSEVTGIPLKPDSLVGSFFHSNHERGWQGCIVAEPSPGIYLVELFEWIAGSSSNQALVSIGTMLSEDWHFYDTADWMTNAYENGLRQQWEREREAEQSE